MADEPLPDEPLTSGSHGGGTGHGTTAVVVALLVDLAAAAATFAAFAVSGSSALLATGVGSVAGVGSLALLLVGGRRAKRASTHEHPLGYGRERYFWAFVVTLVLFGLGSAFGVALGIHRLDGPDAITSPEWALGALGFAVVAQGVALRTAVHAADDVRAEASWWRFIRRAKAPELPVVLLQALGVLIGLAVALAGVGAAVGTDDPIYDAYATIAVGVVLAVVTLVLVVEMKSLLIGESASRKQIEAIRAAIEIEPDVIGIIHLRTEHLGPEELLVGTKVEFMHELTVAEVASTIDRVERIIRSAVPAARVIYIEPDVHRDHRSAAFVAEHEGHIDSDDPHYEEITGHVPEPREDPQS